MEKKEIQKLLQPVFWDYQTDPHTFDRCQRKAGNRVVHAGEDTGPNLRASSLV